VAEFRSNRSMPGVITTQHNKSASVMSMVWDLYENRVSFCDEFCVLEPHLPHSCATMKEKILTQAGNVRKEYGPNQKWTYSGKTKDGQQDDLVIALLLACHHSLAVAITSQQYIDNREQSR
jgi:hypothetical protein